MALGECAFAGFRSVLSSLQKLGVSSVLSLTPEGWEESRNSMDFEYFVDLDLYP